MLDLRAGEAPLFAFHDHAAEEESFLDAVLEGLSRPDKAIPCRFLYDERGSALFDAICELPEYYPTRTETAILTTHAGDIAALAGARPQLIELGSGSSIKVRILLDALVEPAAYVAVDVSREHLKRAASALAADFPQVQVCAICADYCAPFPLPELPAAGRRIAFFPGSTIGNLEPEEALAFLRLWSRRLGPGAAMLVGVDLKKDVAGVDGVAAVGAGDMVTEDVRGQPFVFQPPPGYTNKAGVAWLIQWLDDDTVVVLSPLRQQTDFLACHLDTSTCEVAASTSTSVVAPELGGSEFIG